MTGPPVPVGLASSGSSATVSASVVRVTAASREKEMFTTPATTSGEMQQAEQTRQPLLAQTERRVNTAGRQRETENYRVNTNSATVRPESVTHRSLHSDSVTERRVPHDSVTEKTVQHDSVTEREVTEKRVQHGSVTDNRLNYEDIGRQVSVTERYDGKTAVFAVAVTEEDGVTAQNTPVRAPGLTAPTETILLGGPASPRVPRFENQQLAAEERQLAGTGQYDKMEAEFGAWENSGPAVRPRQYIVLFIVGKLYLFLSL